MYDMPTSFRRKGSNLRLTKDDVYQLYVVEKKALREIASMYNVTHQAVAQWLKVFEIDTRDMHDPSIKKKYPKNRKRRVKKNDEAPENQADN
jgi:predicted DNA-binding protein YlxM (UPF0122 family)